MYAVAGVDIFHVATAEAGLKRFTAVKGNAIII